MKHFVQYGSIVLLVSLLLAACDEWDDHNKIVDESLAVDLMQTIKTKPELSTFAGYLVSTGYDEILASSKKFTVWAPDNAALQNLDEGITNDPEELKQFIGNHISYQEYFTETPKPALRIKMLNGKYLVWRSAGMDDAGLISTNQVAKNGVLHVVDQGIIPKLNSWEVLMHSAAGAKHAAFLASLNYTQFDESQAVQTGIDPATGKPVYQEGTGFVERNSFLDSVANIKEEDSLYTFILLTDDVFDAQLTSLRPLFNTSSLNQDSLASWYLVRDLVFLGAYTPDELPAVLTSRFNVQVPLDKSAIIETHYTSNGMVYILNQLELPLQEKFLPIVVEGEQPSAFSRSDKSINIHYRYRDFASRNFDLHIQGHSVALFNVLYNVRNVPAVKYAIYWVAVNDFLANTFQQRLMIGSPVANTFPYLTVEALNYNEVYIGEYTVDTFGDIDLYLVGANSTNNNSNPLVLDYLKLVPVF